MLRACIVCAATSSSPGNFLLTCASCAVSYHHRCHTPVLADSFLITLVKASTDLVKGFVPRDETQQTLQNWKCAACTKHPTIPRAPSLPALIDLTIASDGDKHDKHSEDHTVEAEEKVNVVNVELEEDIKPAHRERVKAEQLPDRLPPRKYNIAPTWIHKQHADRRTADAWDRLAQKNHSRRPKKVAEPRLAVKPFGRQSFISLAPLWLESRQSTLPI